MNLTLRVAYKCSLSMILHNENGLKVNECGKKENGVCIVGPSVTPTCMIYIEDGKLCTCIVLFSQPKRRSCSSCPPYLNNSV